MKKVKQTEEDLLYGTVLRTPTKRRLAATPTPGKTRKVLASCRYLHLNTPNVKITCVWRLSSRSQKNLNMNIESPVVVCSAPSADLNV